MQCLKWKKVKLELITDPEMFIFFEKGSRGGIFYSSNRYSKANNKYLKSYNSKQDSKEIAYLDTDNLYCYAMPKFLLISGFKWIGPKEFDLNKYTSNTLKGWVLEVDIEYPKELHELQNDYPLVPDKIKIKRKMLPEYQLKIIDSYNVTLGNVKNLVSKIFDKKSMWFIMKTYNFTLDWD